MSERTDEGRIVAFALSNRALRRTRETIGFQSTRRLRSAAQKPYLITPSRAPRFSPLSLDFNKDSDGDIKFHDYLLIEILLVPARSVDTRDGADNPFLGVATALEKNETNVS